MYSYHVDYQSKGASHSSGEIGGKDTLEATRAQMDKSIAYYRGLEAEFGAPHACFVYHAAIELRCDTCGGDGTVLKTRGRNIYGRKVCPTCKGKNSIVPVECPIGIDKKYWPIEFLAGYADYRIPAPTIHEFDIDALLASPLDVS